ncbi:helix-turn-helix domain-containing protein [Shewanella corallii]|uniref:Helix-turn-helix domain-containing protein n=1 Tax=Shewanella corallii TaxID=560080 RepID=A0ABT0N1J0_9GAMM|nr:helix-turn-helix transcriptional regulator [Shewanella corallii]MCL2912303.1 helix-turn-helix domain-containing protein [Shewanella corallii]
MILADKIVKLRKQAGWSQEELADKVGVSRQSVSKWESANSIPDLNKIILLSNIFGVSVDYLVNDNAEHLDAGSMSDAPEVMQVSIEEANQYLQHKMAAAELTIKGVLLCVCSVIPLIFFLALAANERLGITNNIAIACGIIGILVMVSWGVSYLIRISQFESATTSIDDEPFELSYGVHSAFQQKLESFSPTYYRRLSIGIFLFISSFLPLMLSAVFNQGHIISLMMLIVLILMIALGLYLVIPASAKFDAFTVILTDKMVNTAKARRARQAKKLAGFYWPLVVAIFLGWSLWTMDWGITWIIWPVSAVLFAALIGLMELLHKDEPL